MKNGALTIKVTLRFCLFVRIAALIQPVQELDIYTLSSIVFLTVC